MGLVAEEYEEAAFRPSALLAHARVCSGSRKKVLWWVLRRFLRLQKMPSESRESNGELKKADSRRPCRMASLSLHMFPMKLNCFR